MKKFATVLMLLSVSSLFSGTPPMPPSFGVQASKPYPASCKTLPRMIVFLPPPMEVDFVKCKNDLNMPTLFETKRAVEKEFGKDVKNLSINLAKGFNQLYQVQFELNGKNRVIFVNSQLDRFIDGAVLNFSKKSQ